MWVGFSLAAQMRLTNPNGYLIFEAFTNTLLGIYMPNNTFTCSLAANSVYMITATAISS